MAERAEVGAEKDQIGSVLGVEWDGSYDGIHIASQTDPWLQIGADYFDLTTLPDDIEGPCAASWHLVLPGVLLVNNGELGIERCDACDLFDGDLAAAQALADHLNNGTTVWFHPEGADCG